MCKIVQLSMNVIVMICIECQNNDCFIITTIVLTCLQHFTTRTCSICRVYVNFASTGVRCKTKHTEMRRSYPLPIKT